MSKLPVLFGLHNHQPLGNFHQVVERLTSTCYRPFLQTISKASWLDNFLESTSRWKEEFIDWTTFSQVMDKVPASGICYLPNASYLRTILLTG